MDTRAKTVKQVIRIIFGLAIFGFGELLSVRANIGLAPWSCLHMGLSYTLGYSYGQMLVAVSVAILILDVVLRETIGLGSLLNALLIGNFVDLWDMILPKFTAPNLIVGVVMMFVGLSIIALGQYFYMSGCLGCGPRDSLMVAIGKRLPKFKIGMIQLFIQIFVLAVGFVLGGPVGVGTLIGGLLTSYTMQLVFGLLKFDPRNLTHDSFRDTFVHFRTGGKE